jgi:hypothetical protein
MARIRLNQEYRNKIANRLRVHLEQENTQEKESFYQKREQMKPLQGQTWNLAKEIVSRLYTPEDIKMAYHLQNKLEEGGNRKMWTLLQKIVAFILVIKVK